MAENSVKVELSVDEQKALRSITSLVKKFDDLGDSAQGSFKKGDAALASFAGNLAAGAVSKGISLVGDAFSFLVSNIGEVVAAGADSQKVLNDLNTALAITGQYSKNTSKDFQDFASALQTSTGVGDEAILSSSTLIQNIAKVNAEQLKQVTYAAVQLSSALGIDLQNASSLVGKALEGNVGSLGRYGIKIKAGKDETETFNNVIQGLSVFAGTAEAKLNTFAGSSGALSERVGDLKESLGGIIIESPATVAAIAGIEKGVLFLDKVIKDNSVSIKSFINNAILFLVDGIGLAADVFSYFNGVIAGGQIMFKFVEQVFFKIDIAVREMGLAINEAAIATREFLGIDLTPALVSYNNLAKASIQNSQDQIDAIDGEINAIVNRTSAQNRAATQFGDTVINSTRQALAEQDRLQKEGNDQYLVRLSEKSAATVAATQQTTDALALLTESQKAVQLEVDANDLLYKQLQYDSGFQLLADSLGRDAALREVYAAQELAKAGKTEEAKLALKKQFQAAEAKIDAQKIAANQKFATETNNIIGQSAQLGAALAKDGSKEAFLIGKAAALAQIGVSTATGMANALLIPDPTPTQSIRTAAVLQAQILGAISATTVAATAIKGFKDGGIVGGSSFSGDKVAANVNSGEMILNRQQQSKLFKDINSGGNGSIFEAIQQLGDRISNMMIVVQADGREIARLVRDQKLTGFSV